MTETSGTMTSMANEPEERCCTATNRHGQPCRARPLHDHDTCAAHTPNSAVFHRFHAGAPGGPGRPRVPRPTELLTQRIEQHVVKRLPKVLGVWDDGLEAERLVVVGRGEDAVVEREPDHPIRLRTVDSMLDRGLGRPRQAVEVSGPDGDALELVVAHRLLQDPDAARHASELARRLEIEGGEAA